MLLKHITRNLDFFRFFHLSQLFSSGCTMCNVRDVHQFNVVLVVLAFQGQRQDSRGIKRCQARNTKLDRLFRRTLSRPGWRPVLEVEIT